jgi:hypothetical protein
MSNSIKYNTKITSLSTQVARELSTELELVIQKTLRGYGLGAKAMGGKLGNNDVTLKFKIYVTNEDGEDAGKEGQFKNLADRYGLRCQYGDKFTVRDTTLKVVGISPNRRKYPVDLLNVSTGKTMKAPIDYVNLMVNGSAS